MRKLFKCIGFGLSVALVIAVTLITIASIWSFMASFTHITTTHINSRVSIVESKEETKRTGIEWSARTEIAQIESTGKVSEAHIESTKTWGYNFRWSFKMAVFASALLLGLVELRKYLRSISPPLRKKVS